MYVCIKHFCIKQNTDFPLVWIPRHINILGNCRADEFARAGILLPESYSIELGIGTLDIFFKDVNLSWVNKESCSTARLNWLLTDRRFTNQLLGLYRDIISITVDNLRDHCIMDRHGERMRLPFNDFCRGCIFAGDYYALLLSVPVLEQFVSFLS